MYLFFFKLNIAEKDEQVKWKLRFLGVLPIHRNLGWLTEMSNSSHELTDWLIFLKLKFQNIFHRFYFKTPALLAKITTLLFFKGRQLFIKFITHRVSSQRCWFVKVRRVIFRNFVTFWGVWNCRVHGICLSELKTNRDVFNINASCVCLWDLKNQSTK